MIAGVELLATLSHALGSGDDISLWCGTNNDSPPTLGEEKDGMNAAEKLHGLFEPINTYLHAIAEMVTSLRGNTDSHGLVTANGYYLTKHSLGLYSTQPGKQPWQMLDSLPLQQ